MLLNIPEPDSDLRSGERTRRLIFDNESVN